MRNYLIKFFVLFFFFPSFLLCFFFGFGFGFCFGLGWFVCLFFPLVDWFELVCFPVNLEELIFWQE